MAMFVMISSVEPKFLKVYTQILTDLNTFYLCVLHRKSSVLISFPVSLSSPKL